MEQPKPLSLPRNLPAKVVGSITRNIVVILGITIVVVVVGSILLAWFDKEVPSAIIAMAGVALGYLGNAIQGDEPQAPQE